MKRILFIVGLLISISAFASSGRLSFEPAYYFGSEKVAPKIGLGVYQSITEALGYDMWTGFGWSPVSGSSVVWFSSKHDLLFYWGRMTFGLGFTYRAADDKVSGCDLIANPDIHIKIAYRLW